MLHVSPLAFRPTKSLLSVDRRVPTPSRYSYAGPRSTAGLRRIAHLAGDAPSWAPRTTWCKTDIHSRPLWRRVEHAGGASRMSFVVRESSILGEPLFRALGLAMHAPERGALRPIRVPVDVAVGSTTAVYTTNLL